MNTSNRMLSPAEIAAAIARNQKEAAALPPPRVRAAAAKPNRLVSGGLALTPGGRLWATWLMNGESKFSHPLAAFSDDGGASWSEPCLRVEEDATPNGLTRSSLCSFFWTAPDGRLFWFFDHGLGIFDGLSGVWMAVCDNPDAATASWTQPQRLWHGVPLNKPLVLASGEWLLPISLWFYPIPDAGFTAICGHEHDTLRGAHVLASSDQGKTWQRRGMVKVPDQDWSFNEPNLMERRDGSLLMYLRTAHGLAEAESQDGGLTWSEPRPSASRHPPARLFVAKLASGAWLMVKHAVSPKETELRRQRLTAYVSDDEGVTWTGGLELDGRYGVSYPDGCQGPDGRIYVVYDHVRTDGELLLAVFREEDVRAERLESDAGRLRRVVHRLPGYEDSADEKFVHVKLIANQ